MLKIILLLLISLSFSTYAEELENFAYSKVWLNLLYYNGTTGNYKSAVTNKKFFRSSDGKTNPLSELKADIQAFQEDYPLTSLPDDHPQCLFPARYLLLKKHFPLKPAVSCPKLNQWINHYVPENIVLVYASQYISNPASVFGHSFLLQPSAKQTRGFWLTFNYAASMPKDISGVNYILGGVSGRFDGEYSVMPFYHRIFQYGSIENRDLWLYEIRMTPEERLFFIVHLWELVHAANFKYYFFDENCAGILLRTLAAVFPDMQHANKLPIYVHPMEVIRALQRANRLAEVDLIPSQNSLLQANLETLNPAQLKRFKQALKHNDSSLADADSPVVEALMQYTSFMTHKNQNELPSELKILDRNAHVQRARFPTPPIEFKKTEILKQAPHLSHESSAWLGGASLLNGKGALDFGYRFSLHDFQDADAGFLKNSTVEGPVLRLSANEKHIWIQDFNLARVENYSPFLWFNPKASWRFKLSVRENILTENVTDQFVQMKTGYGITLEYGLAYYYLFLTGDFNFGKFPQAYFETGPELGAILNFGKFKSFVGLGGGGGPFDGSYYEYLKLVGGLSFNINRDLSIVSNVDWYRLTVKGQEGNRAKLELRYYF